MLLTFKGMDSNSQFEVTSVDDDAYLPIVTLADGRRFYVADEFDQASEAAVLYWQNVIDNTPDKLSDMIGESVLRNWLLAKEDGPGHEKVNTSLKMWVENTVAKHPDVAFGHCAGSEYPISMSADLADRVGFDPEAETMVSYPVPSNMEKGTIPPPEMRGDELRPS